MGVFLCYTTLLGEQTAGQFVGEYNPTVTQEGLTGPLRNISLLGEQTAGQLVGEYNPTVTQEGLMGPLRNITLLGELHLIN